MCIVNLCVWSESRAGTTTPPAARNGEAATASEAFVGRAPGTFGRYNGRDSSSSFGLINGREFLAVRSPPSALLRSAALALLRIRLASVAYAARVDAIRPSSCVC
ncbi:unnamed protein product [Sphagnum jensenii]|uniref:Secreted protein n=1 Tax=Sphagnum jensenii TaxID=128206 RepID=A0ABP1B1Y5_9BRYO